MNKEIGCWKKADMKIVINLLKDWADQQIQDLRAVVNSGGIFTRKEHAKWQSMLLSGKRVSNVRAVDNMLVCLEEYRQRIVPPRPRTCHIRNGVEKSCPVQYITGFRQLKHEIETGVSLYRRQSRRIGKIDQNDGMLNDWGIQHFHLGDCPDLKHPSLIKGTDRIAFAFVTDTDVYIIRIGKHGEWGDENVLRELNNWKPKLLAKYKIGCTSAIGNVNPKEREKLRSQGWNVCVDGGASIIMPIGQGNTLAGSSVCARRKVCKVRQKLSRAQRIALKQFSYVLSSHRRNNYLIRFESYDQKSGIVVVSTEECMFSIDLTRSTVQKI